MLRRIFDRCMQPTKQTTFWLLNFRNNSHIYVTYCIYLLCQFVYDNNPHMMIQAYNNICSYSILLYRGKLWHSEIRWIPKIANLPHPIFCTSTKSHMTNSVVSVLMLILSVYLWSLPQINHCLNWVAHLVSLCQQRYTEIWRMPHYRSKIVYKISNPIVFFRFQTKIHWFSLLAIKLYHKNFNRTPTFF